MPSPPASEKIAPVLKDFKAFILRGNVLDLAVAVVIGVAFTAVITALVTDLITPLVAAIFGSHDFSSLTFTVNNSVFRYGAFLNALLPEPLAHVQEREAQEREVVRGLLA